MQSSTVAIKTSLGSEEQLFGPFSNEQEAQQEIKRLQQQSQKDQQQQAQQQDYQVVNLADPQQIDSWIQEQLSKNQK